MKARRQKAGQGGFSLIEMMIAAVIFVLLCGAAFALLSVAQQRYQTESQILNSFQEARFGLDDMVRDVNGSGFPTPSEFTFNPTGPPANYYASTPVAWSQSAGYPATPCQIATGGGGNCVSSSGPGITPGDFDVIIERDPNPSQNLGVQWIRYQLANNTLMRAQVPKTAGGDPDASTSAAFVPYVQNVMNNATSQITQFQGFYPQMFPGGQPVPVFSYTCYTPGGTQPCTTAGSYNSPAYVTDVEITLIVMAPTVDAQTGAPRLIELQGRGHSINSVP
jgi:prepilin-type N-terminal cleavage/methylation domain-containing protein